MEVDSHSGNLPLLYGISTLLPRSSFISSMLTRVYASAIRLSACFAARRSSESKGGSIVGRIRLLLAAADVFVMANGVGRSGGAQTSWESEEKLDVL